MRTRELNGSLLTDYLVDGKWVTYKVVPLPLK